MCFDICTINMCVSIRVRGLHLVFLSDFFSQADADAIRPRACNTPRSVNKVLELCRKINYGVYFCNTLTGIAFAKSTAMKDLFSWV